MRLSKTVTVAIEGPAAGRALSELLAVDGIQGDAAPPRAEVERDGGLLVATGAIVGILGGVATIVDKIVAWRDRWKASRDADRLSVVLEDAKGNRLVLDDATPQQIAAALQTLAS